MLDQVIINGVGSYDTYEASMKERVIGEPKKKVIKQTIPFSNKTYDFSKIDGEFYWEERELEYVFEITADDPVKLEDKKRAFKSWVMQVMEKKLVDPFIERYHFIATFDDISFDDSEFEKTTAVVNFKAYPYLYRNSINEAMVSFSVATSLTSKSLKVQNNSPTSIAPYLRCTGTPVKVYNDGIAYNIPVSTGFAKYENFRLKPGVNNLAVTATPTTETEFSLYFNEEVL